MSEAVIRADNLSIGYNHSPVLSGISLAIMRGSFSELSGGQKQRVLIARALVTKATVLVLDEPTSSLDATATHSLLEFIAKLHGERKLTTILVSHDLALVRRHAQQIIWLHQGKVLQGTTSELLTRERMAEIFELELG